MAMTGCGGCGGGSSDSVVVPPDVLEAQRLTDEATVSLASLLADPSAVNIGSLSPIADKFKTATEKDAANKKAKLGYLLASSSREAQRLIDFLPAQDRVADVQAYPAKVLLRHAEGLRLGWRDGKVWRGTPEDGAPLRSMTTVSKLWVMMRASGANGQTITDFLNDVYGKLLTLDQILAASPNLATDSDPMIFVVGGVPKKFGAVELAAFSALLKATIAELDLSLAYDFTGTVDLSQSIFRLIGVDETSDGSAHVNATVYLPPAPYGTLSTSGRARLQSFGSQGVLAADAVIDALTKQESRSDQTGWFALPPESFSSSYTALKTDSELLKAVLTEPVNLVVDPQITGEKYLGTMNVPLFLNSGAPSDLRSFLPRWNREYFASPPGEVLPGDGIVTVVGLDFGGLLNPKHGGWLKENPPIARGDAIVNALNVCLDPLGRGWDEVPFQIKWVFTRK
jgi:hypothetical protein